MGTHQKEEHWNGTCPWRADLLLGVTVEPGGPVTGHACIRSCTSLPDLIGWHLLVEYCGRTGLAHQSAVAARQPPGEEGAVGHKP